MYKELAAMVFLTLILVMISWLANAAEENNEDRKVQIQELREKIQELEYALEHEARESNDEKMEELKAAIKEHRQKLARLEDKFFLKVQKLKAQKSQWVFPEIQLAIERAESHLAELRHVMEVLQDEGAEPDMLEAIQENIARKEAQLEELRAHLEQRRTERDRELEDKEIPIRELKGKIQELKHALEGESNPERAEELETALKRHINQLERRMADFREMQNPKWDFPEIQIAIERTKGHLDGLRQAVNTLKERGAEPERLEQLRQKIDQRERELVELSAHLKQRNSELEREKEKGRARMVIISLKHADALNLEGIIERFLTPSGIIAADPDSNSLVIKDLPEGLENALKITRELDVPRREMPLE